MYNCKIMKIFGYHFRFNFKEINEKLLFLLHFSKIPSTSCKVENDVEREPSLTAMLKSKKKIKTITWFL